MKIGILGSGNDMLSLFTFLHRYDAEFVVWIDDLHFSWGDKPFSFVSDRVNVGLSFLREQGVDVVLVPPVIELLMVSKEVGSGSEMLGSGSEMLGSGSETLGSASKMLGSASETRSRVSKETRGIASLPLYLSYLQGVLSTSLVGKIGFVGDWLDVEKGQHVFEHLTSGFVLTDAQRATKKFQVPFAWWGKEVRNWKYFLDTMSWSHPLMNRLVKQDLRYFKDADVDTLLPMNYGYFLLEKVIHKACNESRLKFHGMDVLEQVFARVSKSLLVPVNQGGNSLYSVKVFCTGHGAFLTRSKKLMWLLGRGNAELVEVNVGV